MEAKKALLLDMNGTFMFGEDRFGDSEDFSVEYSRLGGSLPPHEINRIVRAAYAYLDERYPDETYRECFPSVAHAIREVADHNLSRDELSKIVATFAHHELGIIPMDYAEALKRLRTRFQLAAVIDIWSPKGAWLSAFAHAGISSVFSAISFSSDHGMVKPSPKPFLSLLKALHTSAEDAVVIGDSPRRDLGGASNAGIECILVGGATHSGALASFGNLLELCAAIERR
jgi:HAD superfamily hydrolase (TIGR01549 family)